MIYKKGQILIEKDKSSPHVYKIVAALNEGTIQNKVKKNIDSGLYLPCHYVIGNSVKASCYYVKLCKLDNFLNNAIDDCEYILSSKFDTINFVEASFPLGYIFYSPRLGQSYVSKYKYSNTTEKLIYEAIITKGQLSFVNKLDFTEERLAEQKAYSINVNDIVSQNENVYKIEYIKPTESNWSWSTSKIIHLKYIGLTTGVSDEDVSYKTLIEKYCIGNTVESKKALIDSLQGNLEKIEKSFDLEFTSSN